MGLDIAKTSLEFLPRPRGAAYEFAWTLPPRCTAFSEGNAFGSFLRSELHRAAADYIEEHDVDWEGQKAILDWVESLPYHECGDIDLNFNW